MTAKEFEVVSSIMWHGHKHSPYYDENADTLMLPTIVGSGMHEQLVYFKIPGEEIRKCLNHKEKDGRI